MEAGGLEEELKKGEAAQTEEGPEAIANSRLQESETEDWRRTNGANKHATVDNGGDRWGEAEESSRGGDVNATNNGGGQESKLATPKKERDSQTETQSSETVAPNKAMKGMKAK